MLQINRYHLYKLKKDHRELDEQVKKLYNTTSSESTLKQLKVKKLKLKDAINKLEGEGNGKEN